MHDIRALTFDLDDTLWPVAPVIEAAETQAYDWLVQNHPEVTQRYDQDGLRELRFELAQSHPEIAHNLTELRARSLQLAFSRSGTKTDGVAKAMAVFLEARNAVQPYADSVDALRRLSQNFPLAALSNGNADISRTPLAEFFTVAVSAEDAGCAKPDPRIFQLTLDKLGLEAHQVLHIGDHQEQDVLGALDAGMQAMWMARHGQAWQHPQQPHFHVENLTQAADLLLG